MTVSKISAKLKQAEFDLSQSPYNSYAYAYPHKTAYRPFEQPVSLAEVWAAENRQALFLYLHIPFCEMRCGFCNLFTTVNPKQDFVAAYLATLERQARLVREALGAANFARVAIGGGTPTFLTPAELNRVLDIAELTYGITLSEIAVSVETSPATATTDRLTLLRERGVDRISIGVQSFNEAEAHSVGRPQKNSEVTAALERLKNLAFPRLNIDLIYGLAGQDKQSWLASLQTALNFQPEELYLYPLYTRPLTGLGRTGKSWDDQRLELYRAGRDFLLSKGYEQISMRMFQRADAAQLSGPVYCCQEDGMVGLGCGARSYTRQLHYSSEYAVSATGVKAIINSYNAEPDENFTVANYGFRLDADEERRRYLIQSLLQVAGLSLAAYRARFGREVLADYPELAELLRLELATLDREYLKFTPAGLERSDALGPWLYSAAVRTLMEGYELR